MKKLKEGFVDKVIADMTRKIPQGGEFHYVKLIVLWTLIEAWIDSLGSFKNTHEGLSTLRKTNNNPFFDTYSGMRSEFKGLLSTAQAMNIQILPPDKSKRDKNVSIFQYPPGDNPADVIALIYDIRNNIVHGDYQIDWSNEMSAEKNLIFVAANALGRWIRIAREYGVFR